MKIPVCKLIAITTEVGETCFLSWRTSALSLLAVVLGLLYSNCWTSCFLLGKKK